MSKEENRISKLTENEFSFVMLEIRESNATPAREHFKIGYVLRGDGEISINGNEHHISAGTLYLITYNDESFITVNN